MKLAINLATRGRPELLLKTVEQTLANIRESGTTLMLSVDADDEATIAILPRIRDLEHWIGDKCWIADREDTIAAKWNRVLTVIPDADVYMPMCDDGPVLTPGFDTTILEAAERFPDGIGVVTNYLENLTFPGIQAVTADLARLMGYIYPPLFPYWFVDHWLLDISRMIGRDWFVDVKLDCASNRPPTMEMREPAFWATFYDVLAPERREQAETILSHTYNTTWQTDMLRSQWPKWEQHSRMINDICRNNDGFKMGPAPDDRYLRVKTAALEKMRVYLPLLEAA